MFSRWCLCLNCISPETGGCGEYSKLTQANPETTDCATHLSDITHWFLKRCSEGKRCWLNITFNFRQRVGAEVGSTAVSPISHAHYYTNLTPSLYIILFNPCIECKVNKIRYMDQKHFFFNQSVNIKYVLKQTFSQLIKLKLKTLTNQLV